MATPLLNLDTVTERYYNLATRATYDQHRQACGWYDEANRLAHTIVGIDPTLNIEKAASIIAAFSPRVHWVRNIRLAVDFVAGNPVKCLGMSLRMAESARTMGFAALKGPKTNAFARAISGDSDAVVIDAHMAYAADDASDGSVNLTQYRLCANAVRIVSGRIGMVPSATQALVWIVQRGRAD